MNNNLYAPPLSQIPGERAPAQRYAIWGLCLVTLCITIAFIRAVKVGTGIDPFSITFWGFVPVGAMLAAAAATSGYMLAAHRLHWQADLWDLLFLMAACLMLQVLLVAVDYWALLLARPSLSGQLSYSQYFAESLTQAQYTVQSRQYGTSRPQAIGESGWILLLPRLGCLLAIAKVIHGNVGRAKVYPSY
jgi:hypothetical protein